MVILAVLFTMCIIILHEVTCQQEQQQLLLAIIFDISSVFWCESTGRSDGVHPSASNFSSKIPARCSRNFAHFMKSEVHSYFHKSAPLDPVLSEMNPFHIHIPYFLKTAFKTTCLQMYVQSDRFPAGFPNIILYTILFLCQYVVFCIILFVSPSSKYSPQCFHQNNLTQQVAPVVP